MQRRTYLATVGSAAGSLALAGCSGDDSDDSDDGGPQYDQDSEEGMLLSLDAFPDGWVRDDDLNEDFDAGFSSEDESVIVLVSVEVFDEVSEAEDRIETIRAGVSDPNDYPIADEAFWATRNQQLALTLFRDSNAVGQVTALRESGTEVVPDQSRSQQYAETMYDQW